MASTVEEICPSVEDITRKETRDPLPCPTRGCSRVFHNRPCLRMHLIKTHGVASNSEEKQLYVRGQTKNQVEKHFYCPVKHCVRGRGTKRPFPRMSQLKQHYMTVHAEKNNVCSKCGKGFGLSDACRRHELKCGQLFTCSCGCPYTTVEALLTHAQRQMHKLPECYTKKKESSKPPVPASTVTLVVVKPVVPVIACTGKKNSGKNGGPCPSRTKLCPILPKPGPSIPLDAGKSLINTAKKQVFTKSVETQTPFDVHSMHTQTTSHPSSTEQACDSYTQTPPPITAQQFQFTGNSDGGSLGIGFNNQASVGIQVAMLANHSDFGVGTDDSFLAQLGCFTANSARQPFRLPQATPVQHLPPISSFVTGQQRPSFVTTNENSMQTLDIDPLCLNIQTQTNLTSTDLALSDLRPLSSTQTQTCGLEQVPLEDNETQTLISLLGIDANSSIDSGTQTHTLLDDLFDTQDIELTESQTQTWFTDFSSITSPGLDTSGNEFVYKGFDDLVDIHTQTSIVMSDFSELTDDTEFTSSQTQTLQSDFVCSSLLSSSVQTDTRWAHVTQTDEQIRNGSVTSTSSQTQTLQSILYQSCVVSSVETQT